MTGIWTHRWLLYSVLSLTLLQLYQGWAFVGRNLRMGPFSASKRLASVFTEVSSSAATDQELRFPESHGPYLSVITERCSCDSDERMKETLEALHKAVSTSKVDLIYVRISRDENSQEKEARVEALARQLVKWSEDFSFRVVLSSDWRHIAAKTGVHGVHFPEVHRDMIPEVRRELGPDVLIGTSAHSIESAVEAWCLHHPDYLNVGTCYLTESHPEKGIDDLEGPSLPGQVVWALDQLAGEDRPKVLAVGGINATNCHEPVLSYGADGIATIRAVLHAKEPEDVVGQMKENMASLSRLVMSPGNENQTL